MGDVTDFLKTTPYVPSLGKGVKITEKDGSYTVSDMPNEVLTYDQIVNWAFANRDLHQAITFNGGKKIQIATFLRFLTSKDHPEVKKKATETEKGRQQRLADYLAKLTPEERERYFNQKVTPRQHWEKD